MENARPLPRMEVLAEMPPQERPQERMEKYGARALRDAELLAMLLRTGTAAEDVLTVAARLVHDAGSLANLVGWTAEEFARQSGVGKVKSLQLVAVMEIARRVVEQGKEANPVLLAKNGTKNAHSLIKAEPGGKSNRSGRAPGRR